MNFSIGKIVQGVRSGIGAIMNGNFPIVDVYQREYSNPYSKNIVIPITSATQRLYQIPDLDFFRDKLIMGLATRKQNAGDTRISKDGHKLINDAGMASAFLRLSQNNLQVQESLPLEFCVHEPSGQANTYAQVMLEQGFTPQSSSVEFSIDPGAGNVGRDVELIVFYVPLEVSCYQ